MLPSARYARGTPDRKPQCSTRSGESPALPESRRQALTSTRPATAAHVGAMRYRHRTPAARRYGHIALDRWRPTHWAWRSRSTTCSTSKARCRHPRRIKGATPPRQGHLPALLGDRGLPASAAGGAVGRHARCAGGPGGGDGCACGRSPVRGRTRQLTGTPGWRASWSRPGSHRRRDGPAGGVWFMDA